ncbi:hypothetical protein EBB07_29420 [Paenibacillaceae bacterium]|nr:hypothetical protein EBB07_29420 [Paenibacillaceae bacterium]
MNNKLKLIAALSTLVVLLVFISNPDQFANKGGDLFASAVTFVLEGLHNTFMSLQPSFTSLVK